MGRDAYVTLAAGLIVAAIVIAALLIAGSMMADTADHLRFSGSNAQIDPQLWLRVRFR